MFKLGFLTSPETSPETGLLGIFAPNFFWFGFRFINF
jgi:hypothetical protein